MGVHGLWKLIESAGKPVPVETLDNKVLAVDVSIWLHQLMKGYQTPAGGSVSNAYLIGLFTRVCKLLFTNVKPVFVFDGGVPQLKKKTIAARQQQKNRSTQAAEKVREQLLKNLLKQKAVGQVLEEIRGTASPKKQAPDMFELPPIPENESESEVEEMSDSESEEDVKPVKMKYRDLHTVDVKSAEFKSLPADMRHDILTELKETRKQNSWGRIHEMPEESGDFSQYQMARLLKRRSVQVSLEEAEKEMGGKTLNLQDVEALLAEGGVEINPQLSKRIASDNVTRFIYVTETGELSSQNSTDDSTTKIIKAESNISLTDITPTSSLKIKQEPIEIDSDDSFDVELVKEVEAIEMVYNKIKREPEEEFESMVNEEFAVEEAFEHNSDSEGVIMDDLDLINDNSGLSQDQILAIIKKENENKMANAMFDDSVDFPSSSERIETTQSENEYIEDEAATKPSPSKSQILDITQNAEHTQSKILDSVYFKIYETKMQSALSKKSKSKSSRNAQTTIDTDKNNEKESIVKLSAQTFFAESDSETHNLPCTVFELERPKTLFAGSSKNLSLKLSEQFEKNKDRCDAEVAEMSVNSPSENVENRIVSKLTIHNKNPNEESVFENETNFKYETLSEISVIEKTCVDTNERKEAISKELPPSHDKKDNSNATTSTIESKPKKNYTSKPKRVAHQPKTAINNSNLAKPSAPTPKLQGKVASIDDIFAKIFSKDFNTNETVSASNNVIQEKLLSPVNKSSSLKSDSKNNVPYIKSSENVLNPSLEKPLENITLDQKSRPRTKNIGNLIKEINTKSCKLNESVTTITQNSKTSEIKDNILFDRNSKKNKVAKSHSGNEEIAKILNTNQNISAQKSNQGEAVIFLTKQILNTTNKTNEGLQICLNPSNTEIEDDMFADIFCDDKNNFVTMSKISNLINKDPIDSDQHKNNGSNNSLIKAKKVLFKEEPLEKSTNKLNVNRPLENMKYSVPTKISPLTDSSHLPTLNTEDEINPDTNVEIMSESDDSEDVDDPVENEVAKASSGNLHTKSKLIKSEMDVAVFTLNASENKMVTDCKDVSQQLDIVKTNNVKNRIEVKKHSSEGLQITIKTIKNPIDEDIFADVFTSNVKETEMLLENKDTIQNSVVKEKRVAEVESSKQRVSEGTEMSKTIISKEASISTPIASLNTSSFDSPTFNTDQSSSEEINSPSTSETQITKPKRTLNMKQLEKLQDILETKERKLVIDHNREDRMATSITDQMYQEAQELLRLFGVPWVVAPMEAEAQCAFLDAAGLTQGTITDDSDIWLFGGRKVYKNFFDQKKFVLEFQAENIQQYFKLSRSHLVLLALLVGSDYTVGLTGVGPVTALEILATFPVSTPDSRDPSQLLVSLHRFKQWWQNRPQSYVNLAKKLKNLDLHEGFPSSAVVNAYLQPMVDESREPFSWGSPDLPGLRDFAERRFGWNRERIDQLLLPAVNKLNQRTSQLTLHTFFGAVPNIPAHREQMSRRVQTAINRLEGGSEDFEPLQPQPRQPRGRGRGRGVVRGGRGGETRGRGRGQAEDDNDDEQSKTEVIPQREKDKLEALKRKQQAIDVLKSKKPKGMKKRRNVRQMKAQADLSESSSDD